MCWIYATIGHCNQHQSIKLFGSFMKIQARWPDATTRKQKLDFHLWFHRLAIMDTSDQWDQPFYFKQWDKEIRRVCNGEIYNYETLKKPYLSLLRSSSDCEVLWHLFLEYGIEKCCQLLDGEFAFVIIQKDSTSTKFWAWRDSYGVRPLYRWMKYKLIWFCSEGKWLLQDFDTVTQFSPWHYIQWTLDTDSSIQYQIIPYTSKRWKESTIEDSLIQAVQKRLISDRPVWCLLSWGLDSSLICGIAAQLLDKPLQTFTIGIKWWTDLEYARAVAKHIGSQHHEFIISVDDALQAIDETIKQIESWDTTSIRASTFQYLIGKKISEQTDIKVILTGEWSDEVTGWYMYFHKAPDKESFDSECKRLIKDIHFYDGLRVDRAMSCHSLEVRVPFLDPGFVQSYRDVDIEQRTPKEGIEKYLLRKTFDEKWCIPQEIIRRKKEAFSDGVSEQSKSWYQIIQEYIDSLISDEEFETQKILYSHCPPDTKEKYYYRKKFREYFGEHYDVTIPYYRMPKWVDQTTDPSARVLEVYGGKNII